MNDRDKKAIHEFVQACHRASEYGLLRSSSGNLSCRLDAKRIMLTASRSWLERLTEQEVSICRLSDGQCLSGMRPTIESVFHLGILRKRPDVNVVLHFQSPYATAISCGDPKRYDFNVFPEVPHYMGTIGMVEYIKPGTAELAHSIIAAAENHDGIILRNHGQVAVGTDYDNVFEKAIFFELACQVLIFQDKPVCLTSQQASAVGGQARGV